MVNITNLSVFILLILSGQFQDHIFGPCPDPELASPDTEAGADIVAGIAPAMVPEGLFEEKSREPVAGPYLPVMGVAAELEVDAAGLGLFEIVGLVVQQDGENPGGRYIPGGSVDSAYSYVYRKLDLANAMGNKEMITVSELDLANRHYLSSHYMDAIAMMEAIDTSVVASLGRLSEYRYLWYDIYHGLAQASSHCAQNSYYLQAEQAHLDLCYNSIERDCIEYYVTRAKILIPQGRYEEVISLITSKLSDPGTSIAGKARLHYWAGRAYNAKGDDENAMIHYATSTRYDFLLCQKTYASVFSLARLCFNRGDIKRAYRYILYSYTNATDMEDDMHITRIAQLLPDIIVKHEQSVSRNRRVTGVMIVSLIALLLALSFAMILLQRNLKRLNKANNEKDVFLREFLSMFSEHINGLERYRSSLRVVSKQMDFDAIQQELRSDVFIDSEWRFLHDKFDKTILGLFPNFVDNINAMLRADCQLGKDIPKGKLSNEFRVLALMRLGITESAKIAKFLRLSPTTVYNYRVKFRNAAVCSREDFESRLIHIG